MGVSAATQGPSGTGAFPGSLQPHRDPLGQGLSRVFGGCRLSRQLGVCKSRTWKKIRNLPLEIPLGLEFVEVLELMGAVPTGLKKG